MTSNFIKNKQIEKKYKSRIPSEVLSRKEDEEAQASTMTIIMKKMHSPRNFSSPLKKFGSVQTYLNVSLAKNLQLEKEFSKVRGSLNNQTST